MLAQQEEQLSGRDFRLWDLQFPSDFHFKTPGLVLRGITHSAARSTAPATDPPAPTMINGWSATRGSTKDGTLTMSRAIRC